MSSDVRSRLEVFDPLLYEVMRETGACSGGIFLLRPGEHVLGLAVTAGLPDLFVRPWKRLWLETRTPVTDAVRERRLIWLPVGGITRYFSPAAFLLPYRFASVNAPLTTGDAVWGAITLLFPASQPPVLAPQQRATVEEFCLELGKLLADAAAHGEALAAEAEPRPMRQLPESTHPTGADALAAVDFAQRLPEGGMALDMEGRITFATAKAAQLVGVPTEALRGQLLWERLPWLGDAAFEEHYRAALFSREPATFTALRPPDSLLSFALYPDNLYPGDSGVSVRITPAPHPQRPEPPAVGGDLRSAPAWAGDPGAFGSDTARLGMTYDLLHLAVMLTEALEVDDIVELAADPIMAMFEAQGVAILALEDGRLNNIGYRGYDAEAIQVLNGARMRWMPTPASKALGNREAAFYCSPDEMDAVYSGMSTLTGKAAWAYLPLMVSDRPVGCCVIAYDHPRTFSLGRRAFLTSLADLLAQALYRALLHDARYQLARHLQAGSLPSALPEVPGLRVAARYRAAAHGMEIGGDFYDLIALDETNAAAAIGDVQGHNPNAAVLMGQVRTAVHATAGGSPTDVLSRTNWLLIDLKAELFTSCLYAHIDLAAHRVRLANAGHPPPLLRHPDGTVSVVHVPPGPPLGIVPDAEYPTLDIPLPPGAELLLYTDGLVETPGEDPDVWTARLAHSLASVGESVDTRADLLLENARAAAGTDDIAILLISTS